MFNVCDSKIDPRLRRYAEPSCIAPRYKCKAPGDENALYARVFIRLRAPADADKLRAVEDIKQVVLIAGTFCSAMVPLSQLASLPNCPK